ncbi:MAG: molecular chaperone DnaK [Chitinivibrionia bacterium]|jgi:RNA polymerase-binding protein DksA|nr:molecular chaperone DnaK [Chitinivibrionia bacterium]
MKRLSDEELLRFRNLLLEEKQKVIEARSSLLEQTVGQAVFDSTGEISHYAMHLGDLASETYDREFNMSLSERQAKYLEQIDDALQRVADKTYGVCQVTGEVIPVERLEAVLTTKYSVEGKEQLKRNNLG